MKNFGGWYKLSPNKWLNKCMHDVYCLFPIVCCFFFACFYLCVCVCCIFIFRSLRIHFDFHRFRTFTSPPLSGLSPSYLFIPFSRQSHRYMTWWCFFNQNVSCLFRFDIAVCLQNKLNRSLEDATITRFFGSPSYSTFYVELLALSLSNMYYILYFLISMKNYGTMITKPLADYHISLVIAKKVSTRTTFCCCCRRAHNIYIVI